LHFYLFANGSIVVVIIISFGVSVVRACKHDNLIISHSIFVELMAHARDEAYLGATHQFFYRFFFCC